MIRRSAPLIGLLALSLSTAARAQAPSPDGGAAAPSPPTATPDDAEIEKALKADAAAQQKSQPAVVPSTVPAPLAGPAPVAPPPGAQPQSGSWASFGRFIQSMNPDLSAIVDFAAGWYSDEAMHKSGDDPGKTGFNAQEVEVALQAVVDPYFRADIFLTIPNAGSLEVEEAYLTTTSLPWNLQLRAGIFRALLGRQNTQHLHMQEFTRRPRLNSDLLGIDGLRAPGLELNWLVPRIPFYLNLAFEVFSVGAADVNAPLQTFGGGNPWDFAYVATAKAFFPTSRSTSLFLGLSYARGKTSQHATENCLIPTTAGGVCATAFDNWYDNLFGVDIYFKWKPANVAQTYHSVAWTTEWFMRQIPDLKILGVPHSQAEGGLYSQVVVQTGRRWFLGLRGEAMGIPKGDNIRTELAAAASVTWTLSEFSRVRVYGEARFPVGTPTPNALFVSAPQPNRITGALFTQFEVAIGAHGAHPF